MNEYIVQQRAVGGTTTARDIGWAANFEAGMLMFGEALRHYPAVRLIDRYSFIGDPTDTVLASWRWDES